MLYPQEVTSTPRQFRERGGHDIRDSSGRRPEYRSLRLVNNSHFNLLKTQLLPEREERLGCVDCGKGNECQW